MATKKRPKKALKPNRGKGKPPSDKPVVTPEILGKIGKRFLQGKRNWEIARECGVDESTVRYHLTHQIRPLWQDQMRSRLAEDLAKVALLEETAWERFAAKAPAETVEQIEKGLVGGKGKIRLVKQAVRTVTRTGEVGWLQIVQWCLDFRARIHAHYAPTRAHVDIGGDMRVAGMGPSEVDQVMLDRLMQRIKERRKQQAALGGER